jgi:integrase
MRHTCASWLAQDGVPDRKIAQILGHSSTRMLGVYAHLDPERHDRIREAWARRIPKAADAGDADLTHAPRVTHL